MICVGCSSAVQLLGQHAGPQAAVASAVGRYGDDDGHARHVISDLIIRNASGLVAQRPFSCGGAVVDACYWGHGMINVSAPKRSTCGFSQITTQLALHKIVHSACMFCYSFLFLFSAQSVVVSCRLTHVYRPMVSMFSCVTVTMWALGATISNQGSM